MGQKQSKLVRNSAVLVYLGKDRVGLLFLCRNSHWKTPFWQVSHTTNEMFILLSQNWLETVYLDTNSVGLVYLGRKSNRKRASQLPIIILRAGNHHAPVRYICRINIQQISRKYGTPISEMVEKKRECKIGRCCTIIIRRATSLSVQSQICANQTNIQSYM